MEFRIADTFTDSLARLTGDEQKAVKTTAFDLQLNPANPGMSFHKLDKAKDKNFWSVRVSSDIRLIVHRSDASLLLCYVDHHDKAYDWAERRKLETHPKTGAAQLVEIRETVKEIVVPVYVQTELAVGAEPAAEKKSIFAEVSDDELLGYGVPAEWLGDVKKATEDTLLALTDTCPPRRRRRCWSWRRAASRACPQPVVAANPFDHPDAQRRFRVMANVEELERALDFPWEKWTVFLHPEQRQWVERDYTGPARVSGSAGTGKTIVALHRAAHLARTHPDARVLLTTFSDTLANALQTKLKRLLGNEPRLAERIDVHSLNAIGLRLYKAHVGQATIASREIVRELVKAAANAVSGHKFGLHFLLTEWEQVVDAWQLENWEAYRDVARLGRKTRLPEAQRTVLWSIFEQVRAELKSAQADHAGGVVQLAGSSRSRRARTWSSTSRSWTRRRTSASPISGSLPRLGGGRPNALFFAGDLGQRIFQQPFSWKALGVDIRGRSRTLRVNYRTSHQIRTQADRLLGPVVTDVDGNSEDRSDTVSVFNGPPPDDSLAQEREARRSRRSATGLQSGRRTACLPHEFGVFVRSRSAAGSCARCRQRSGLAVQGSR